MTYEEFKKELYRNALNQARLWGKTARLVEKGTVCREPQVMGAIAAMNQNAPSAKDAVVKEDMLLVLLQYAPAENALQANTLPECKEEGRAPAYSGILCWKVRTLYERFLREGWQSVLPEIAMKLQGSRGQEPQASLWEKGYEQNCGRLILRPLNIWENREELEHCVYWRYGEIALVLYALLYDLEEDFMTMKVTRGMVERWGVSFEEALTGALLNTFAQMPPRLYHGMDIRSSYDWKDGIFMEEEGKISIEIHPQSQEEGMCGYRLTTVRWLNGAVAFFYPGVRQRLAELLDGDFYVGFTSIHEAVIHPVQHKILGEMKAAIQHTNAVFDRREMLTDKVYRYCRARNELIEV